MSPTIRKKIRKNVYRFINENFSEYVTKKFRILFSKHSKLCIRVNKKKKYFILCNNENCNDNEKVEKISGMVIHEYIHCIQLEYRMDRFLKIKTMYTKSINYESLLNFYEILLNFDKIKFLNFCLCYSNYSLNKCFFEGMAFYYEEKYLNKYFVRRSDIINEYLKKFKCHQDENMIPYILGYLLLEFLDSKNINWKKNLFEKKINPFALVIQEL